MSRWLLSVIDEWVRDVPTSRRKQIQLLGLALLIWGGIALVKTFAPVVSPPVTTPPIAPATVDGPKTIRFPADAPQLAYLKIAQAVVEPVPLLEPFNGHVAYDENRTGRLFSPVAGRIVRALVETGDVVSAGQSVMLLDAPDFADLSKAGSQLKTSRLAYERATALFEAQVIARKDLEMAANNLQQAEADHKRAASRLRHLRQQAGSVAMLAPVNGVVMERKASPGMEVSPSGDVPILLVSDPFHLWVMAELPEQSLGKLKVGQAVLVQVDAYENRIFPGRVDAVGDVLDPQTRRVVVRCSVPNPERLLKPEMYARVTPVNSDQQLPKVANSALVTEGLKSYVFVETEPGALEKREVELSFRGHAFSYVSKGLSGSERVVFAGAVLLNAELAGN